MNFFSALERYSLSRERRHRRRRRRCRRHRRLGGDPSTFVKD